MILWRKKGMDEMTKMSIELGFKGELSKEFYTKLHAVRKVRRRLKIELCLAFSFMAIFCIGIAFSTGLLFFMSVVFAIIAMMIVISVLLVFKQINEIRQARFLEYENEKPWKE